MKYQKANGTFGERTKFPLEADMTEKLDRFLEQAVEVVPLRDVARGDDREGIVAMRHDVDHNLEHAVKFAEWEAARGYRATYFVLHTAWYYEDLAAVEEHCKRIVDLGHEVGLHSNCTVLAAEKFDPRKRWYYPTRKFSEEMQEELARVVSDELERLRRMDLEVVGIAAHGDIRCYEMGIVNEFRFTNLTPHEFGLEYDADELALGHVKMGDNHGKLSGTYIKPAEDKQTFALLHPWHWDMDNAKVAA